ncbi:hypothetical protein NliqN6_2265 [Naganishia liquefaciens]|uniref:ER membrane protein complex subunit 10 n=1 Tax=Naganishia liquefaciens TaxID=104408 RepID=A0A8H3TS21_9TREE|nr:hypothetical protein NliqN6_2265 [Naganishia liquefaciens]
MRLPHLLALAASALAAASASHHTSYTIHRRLLDPSHPAPFTPYGTVETDIDVASYALALQANTGAVVPPRGKFVPAGYSEAAEEGEVDVFRSWVQVAVEIPGRDEEEWPKSAVKACQLIDATRETITLHLSTHTAPSSSGELETHPALQPYAVTYRLQSNSSQSACVGLSDDFKVPLNWNGEASREIEVVLKTKDVLSSPMPLTASIPNAQSSTPDNKPPVEKSFFQKYWVYIVGAGMAIALMGTQEPPQGQQAGASK